MKHSNTKKIILQKSFDFFSTHGYAGASIRQIASAVGIRESAIYNHYKSKEEIFLDILSGFKSQSIGKELLCDELLNDLANPHKFLLNFTNRLIDYWNLPEQKKFMRLLLMEQFTKIGTHELSVTEFLTELRSICKMIFGEMIKAGIIKKTDPGILTEEFIAPLFLLRTEKMTADEIKTMNEVHGFAVKHVDFFWSSVKLESK